MRNEKTDLEREGIRNMSRRVDEVDVVDSVNPNVVEMRQKIKFLEDHLDKAENSLRN